jgi:hypothetical protein
MAESRDSIAQVEKLRGVNQIEPSLQAFISYF